MKLKLNKQGNSSYLRIISILIFIFSKSAILAQQEISQEVKIGLHAGNPGHLFLDGALYTWETILREANSDNDFDEIGNLYKLPEGEKSLDDLRFRSKSRYSNFIKLDQSETRYRLSVIVPVKDQLGRIDLVFRLYLKNGYWNIDHVLYDKKKYPGKKNLHYNEIEFEKGFSSLVDDLKNRKIEYFLKSVKNDDIPSLRLLPKNYSYATSILYEAEGFKLLDSTNEFLDFYYFKFFKRFNQNEGSWKIVESGSYKKKEAEGEDRVVGGIISTGENAEQIDSYSDSSRIQVLEDSIKILNQNLRRIISENSKLSSTNEENLDISEQLDVLNDKIFKLESKLEHSESHVVSNSVTSRLKKEELQLNITLSSGHYLVQENNEKEYLGRLVHQNIYLNLPTIIIDSIDIDVVENYDIELIISDVKQKLPKRLFKNGIIKLQVYNKDSSFELGYLTYRKKSFYFLER